MVSLLLHHIFFRPPLEGLDHIVKVPDYGDTYYSNAQAVIGLMFQWGQNSEKFSENFENKVLRRVYVIVPTYYYGAFRYVPLIIFQDSPCVIDVTYGIILFQERFPWLLAVSICQNVEICRLATLKTHHLYTSQNPNTFANNLSHSIRNFGLSHRRSKVYSLDSRQMFVNYFLTKS